MSSSPVSSGTAALPEISSFATAQPEVDSLDREIFPFFEEEANQELQEVEKELHLLSENTAEAKRVLTDMRRQFHTLKGSANSVGHFRIGALSHAMKVQVEKAIETGVSGCPKEFSKLILEVISLIQKLILEVRDPVHSAVPPGEVLRIAETVRDYPLPRRKPCARIHLP